MSIAPIEQNNTELQDILEAVNSLPNANSEGGGFTPTIDVTPIEGGHQITVSDVDGDETFNVMDGIDGKSAYQIAYDHNFAIGTEAEWIASLKGDDGKSAYEIAYELDSTIGTKEDWIESLKGSDGDDGTSVTHFWEGTKLTITSASGQSNPVDLKGEKGDPFEYEDFTEDQLKALKPVKGTDYFDGDDYILTDADKIEIANETKGLLDDTVQEMREIASGKCKADAFDTVEDMTAWLSDTNNTANLKLGDVFYIRAVDVPDYWWEPIVDDTDIDGEKDPIVELSKYTEKDVIISGIGAARILETTKVELEDYALIANVPNIKVNSAANADTIGGKQIVVSTEAPDPNGEDNQNIITIVI
jgi:hypothetical protein